MVRTLNRRFVLQASLGAGALLSVPTYAKGGLTPIQSTKLADDLLLFQGAGGNVVAATSSDGLLLVDGGSLERSGELLKRVKAETSQRRVQQLVNTHWHWDHTGSNEALAKVWRHPPRARKHQAVAQRGSDFQVGRPHLPAAAGEGPAHSDVLL